MEIIGGVRNREILGESCSDCISEGKSLGNFGGDLCARVFVRVSCGCSDGLRSVSLDEVIKDVDNGLGGFLGSEDFID